MSEDQVINQEDEIVGMDSWTSSSGVVPKTNGVRVKIEKPEIRVNKVKNKEELSEDNPWTYKVLNMALRLLDGIEVTKKDGTVELLYKNKVLFPGNMDLVYAHNSAVKNSQWWEGRQYLGGFKSLCQALGFDLSKPIKVNDDFLEQINGREVLIDIEHDEIQERKGDEWIGTGQFKEKIRKFTAWE